MTEDIPRKSIIAREMSAGKRFFISRNLFIA